MGKVTIGKLKEMLVIETQVEGIDSIVVVPKGSVIEYCSEDDWPHTNTSKDIMDAAKYLKSLDE